MEAHRGHNSLSPCMAMAMAVIHTRLHTLGEFVQARAGETWLCSDAAIPILYLINMSKASKGETDPEWLPPETANRAKGRSSAHAVQHTPGAAITNPLAGGDRYVCSVGKAAGKGGVSISGN